MNKDKLFAPFLMLFAGAVVYICMLIFGYRFKEMVVILLVVLIVFYIIGLIIQNRVNGFIRANEEKEKEEAEREGSVIEKEAPPQDEDGTFEEGSLPPLTGAGATADMSDVYSENEYEEDLGSGDDISGEEDEYNEEPQDS